MPTIDGIIKSIEAIAPTHLQENYDNSGLQVGDASAQATGALLCTDVTEAVVEEAIARGCNLIVSHHPLLFHGLKHISGRNVIERIVIKAIKNDIAIYSAHTSLDNAPQGVSHHIARKLGLSNVKVLAPQHPQAGSASDFIPATQVGSGVIGDIPPTSLTHFLEKVKQVMEVNTIKYSSPCPTQLISKVALCGGAGAFLASNAVAQGAHIYITGDVKYHDFLTYGELLTIADIGHYESEHFTKEIFYDIITEKFPNFATYYSEIEKNPINFI